MGAFAVPCYVRDLQSHDKAPASSSASSVSSSADNAVSSSASASAFSGRRGGTKGTNGHQTRCHDDGHHAIYQSPI